MTLGIKQHYHGEKVDPSSNKGASSHSHFLPQRENLKCLNILGLS